MADQIKSLMALDDSELSAKLGFARRIEEFKESLQTADGLEGDARKRVNDRIEEMLNPRIYTEDLKYTVESAQREAARKKSGKTEPVDLLQGCCDVCPE